MLYDPRTTYGPLDRILSLPIRAREREYNVVMLATSIHNCQRDVIKLCSLREEKVRFSGEDIMKS